MAAYSDENQKQNVKTSKKGNTISMHRVCDNDVIYCNQSTSTLSPSFSLFHPFSSCFFVFFSCDTTPLIGLILPSHSPPLTFMLQYSCLQREYYTAFLHLSLFLSFFLSSLPSSVCRIRHKLITPHLPSLAVTRSLCLALMTSVLGIVTVETKEVRHRDVTNCVIANVCVCVCAGVCVRQRSGTVKHRCK